MEDIQKNLNFNDSSAENSSGNDSTTDSVASDVTLSKYSINKTNGGKLTKKQRKPTRVPDPKVNNRNAVSARENRIRHKIYLETIENELEAARKSNTLLGEELKRQVKRARRLEKEKQYYKNIIGNLAEIRKLVTILDTNFSTATPKNNAPGSLTPQSIVSSVRRTSSSSYEMPSNSYAGSENDFETSSAIEDTWNELLEDEDFGLKTPQRGQEEQNWNNNIADNLPPPKLHDDHSYTSPLHRLEPRMEISATNGICLHVAGGRVSLEFCPTCHWQASQTPPTQLLQDETLA